MTYKVTEYAKLKHVTYRTVWNWIRLGLVTTEKTPSGRLLIVEKNAEKT